MKIDLTNTYIIIPARLGSKGFPFKNRKLFKYTANIINDEYKSITYVTTDDPEIKKYSKEYQFSIIDRPKELAEDTTSIKEVLIHSISEINCDPNSTIILLYLTYPERKWKDIELAYEYFNLCKLKYNSHSMLCRKELKISPYLCLKEEGPDGVFGSQLEAHDFYRRQDYPKCFEISHFIAIFTCKELINLNNNLYSKTTSFYPIDDKIDVDHESDINNLNIL